MKKAKIILEKLILPTIACPDGLPNSESHPFPYNNGVTK